MQFSNSFPETKNHVYDLASADAMSVELNCLNGTISLPYLLQTKYYIINPRVKSLIQLRQLSVTDWVGPTLTLDWGTKKFCCLRSIPYISLETHMFLLIQSVNRTRSDYTVHNNTNIHYQPIYIHTYITRRSTTTKWPRPQPQPQQQ